MNRALVLAFVIAAHGAAAAEDPRGVMVEVQRRARVDSEQYEGVLRVVDAGGRTSEKGWAYRRIGSHGASRTLIRFTSPAEVKGVALLVVSHPDRVSDQWMWTPAINRERRVAVQDRRSRFFGTDFSFEDLEERDVDQFDYELLGEEAVDGEACWKIAATPRPGKRSQYTRSIYWVRKATYTYAQIESYDQSRPVRRLTYRRMERVQGVWTARSLEVQDLARGSRTLLTFEAVKYNEPLSADEFTVQALRRD
jgi:outer membrane lipoprotein-sorting protein